VGSSIEVAAEVYLCAHAAARVGANKGVIPGILAATDVLGVDPAVEFPPIDGVLVLAIHRPGQPTVIGHVGDAAAFAYDPSSASPLTRLTEDHTLGQRMRLRGEMDVGPRYDAGITMSIGRATVGTITVVATTAPVVALMSDGVHRTLSEREIIDIMGRYRADSDAASDALVDAAQRAGSTDDATVAVMTIFRPLTEHAQD
jgi:serine/threonine protein phosphatase PrpC